MTDGRTVPMDTVQASSSDTTEPILFTFLNQQQNQLAQITTMLSELRASQPTPPAAPSLAAAAPFVPAPTLSMPHMRLSGSAALPERYAGDPAGCRTFLLAVELYMADFPDRRYHWWSNGSKGER